MYASCLWAVYKVSGTTVLLLQLVLLTGAGRIASVSRRSARHTILCTFDGDNCCTGMCRTEGACKCFLEIRIEIADHIAEANFKTYRSAVHDATWQVPEAAWQVTFFCYFEVLAQKNVPRLRLYNAWCARPARCTARDPSGWVSPRRCKQTLLENQDNPS